MPAKKQISKEKILDAAFEIVRKEGMDALNVRTLASKCNCSTQPIYLSFKGTDELKEEISNKINATFNNFIENEIASGRYPEYKAVGMGYIRFAKEEKELFKYLLMRNREEELSSGNIQVIEESFDKSTYIIMKNYGLYKDSASKHHSEMWIFVHGIATMFATGYLNWDWEIVSEMITDVFKSLTNKNGENL